MKPFNELNYIGKIFGRLTIIRIVKRYKTNDSQLFRYCLCVCSCGNRKVFRLNNVIFGLSASCGCIKRSKESFTRKRVYKIYRGMLQRCYNPNTNGYKYYGGRGIEVCDIWKNNFFKFMEDMGDPPFGYQLDRIDCNGNYEKTNCRWVTTKEQGNNKRVCYLLTASKLAKKVGYSKERIRQLAGLSGNKYKDILKPYIESKTVSEKGFNRLVFKNSAIDFLLAYKHRNNSKFVGNKTHNYLVK